MQKWFFYSLLGALFFLVGCQAQTEIVIKPVDAERTYTVEEADAIQAVLEERMSTLDQVDVSVSYEFREDVPYFSLEYADDYEGLSAQVSNLATGIGLLEFVDFADLDSDFLTQITTAGTCVVTDYQIEQGLAELDDGGNATSQLCETPVILPDGQPFTAIVANDGLESATVVTGQYNENYVAFVLTDEGTEIFENYTSIHQGDRLAVVVNGQVVSAPTVNAVISREGQITGNFTREEVEVLASQLNSTLLTVPLEVAEINESGGSSFFP